uniref:Uncharacterized protein n=1 Tax=Chrysemys picta bellii TaxID=8478 RepID=A0A8C3PFV5_CHRPI
MKTRQIALSSSLSPCHNLFLSTSPTSPIWLVPAISSPAPLLGISMRGSRLASLWMHAEHPECPHLCSGGASLYPGVSSQRKETYWCLLCQLAVPISCLGRKPGRGGELERGRRARGGGGAEVSWAGGAATRLPGGRELLGGGASGCVGELPRGGRLRAEGGAGSCRRAGGVGVAQGGSFA